MNQLIIIGNGFDLAHGLKTSYNDFLIWYLNKVVSTVSRERIYKDSCITLQAYNYRFATKREISSIADFHSFLELNKEDLKVSILDQYFRKLIETYRRLFWVDIESVYYSELKRIYIELEQAKESSRPIISKQITKLNEAFACLKQRLEEYLKEEVEQTRPDTIPAIEDALLKLHGVGLRKQNKLYFLVFNYTSTIKLYKKLFASPPCNINFIHGELNKETNPMIFGYGDEMDSFYQKMEGLNDNAFLENMKSFGYFKTENYQKLFRFLNSDVFNVHIMGHSCGLSDRILFNSIFEHPKCQKIQLYYHQKSKDENDFFEKTQEISRHFKADKKGDMRTKIVSFEKSKPLVPVEQRL